MSVDEIPAITSDIVVLAVVWDEINGPSIISKAPKEGLADPVSIALQIYLSSVAVFGQHGQTKKIDFSLPLLSISSSHLVRVAFDAWEDTEVRGDERPFFLGFIMNSETEKKVSNYLNDNIWSYMESLKIEKSQFNAQLIYDKLKENLNAKKNIPEMYDASQIDVDYSSIQAINDLNTASELWTHYKDITALKSALKSGIKLESTEDYSAAGNAYFLAGTILFHGGDYKFSLETYLKAANNFKLAEDLLNSAEGMFNAAVCAYRLEDYDLAKTNLLESSNFITNLDRKARMYLYLAQTQFRLHEYEDSTKSFEIAVENAINTQNTDLIGQILSVFASRLQERATMTSASETEKHSLIEFSAAQRVRASDIFIEQEMYTEAGTSLVLASKTYQMLSNIEKAIETLEIASDMFKKALNFISSGQALLDVIGLYKRLEGVKNQEILDIINQATEVIDLITDSSTKNPLLVRVYQEKATTLEKNGSYLETIIFYEEILLLESNFHPAQFLSIKVAYANFLFKIEDYRRAGDLFQEAHENIGHQSNQATKLLKNANISYRRASTAYLQASNIHLHRKEFELALNLYEIALSLLKLVLATTIPSEKEGNYNWVRQNITGLQIKRLILPQNLKKLFEQNLLEISRELET